MRDAAPQVINLKDYTPPAFLISTDSSFITGSYHLVDGGLLASF